MSKLWIKSDSKNSCLDRKLRRLKRSGITLRKPNSKLRTTVGSSLSWRWKLPSSSRKGLRLKTWCSSSSSNYSHSRSSTSRRKWRSSHLSERIEVWMHNLWCFRPLYLSRPKNPRKLGRILARSRGIDIGWRRPLKGMNERLWDLMKSTKILVWCKEKREVKSRKSLNAMSHRWNTKEIKFKHNKRRSWRLKLDSRDSSNSNLKTRTITLLSTVILIGKNLLALTTKDSATPIKDQLGITMLQCPRMSWVIMINMMEIIHLPTDTREVWSKNNLKVFNGEVKQNLSKGLSNPAWDRLSVHTIPRIRELLSLHRLTIQLWLVEMSRIRMTLSCMIYSDGNLRSREVNLTWMLILIKLSRDQTPLRLTSKLNNLVPRKNLRLITKCSTLSRHLGALRDKVREEARTEWPTEVKFNRLRLCTALIIEIPNNCKENCLLWWLIRIEWSKNSGVWVILNLRFKFRKREN